MKCLSIPQIAVLAAAGMLAAACGKSEAPSMKTRANAPVQIPEAKQETKSDTVEANEALKERLARQEAAAKLFDKSKPEPASAKPEPAPAKPAPIAAKAEPAVAKSAPVAARAEPQRQPELIRTAAAAPSPAPALAPAKAPEIAAARMAEPMKAEPAKQEPVRLASAAPTTIPAPTPLAAKLLSRVDPDFPREAVQAGAEKGNVKARLTLDGNGNVTRVDVVEANPRRVFDRAVVRALSQWRFSDGPSGRTVETEIDFKR
jgi:protein TonB